MKFYRENIHGKRNFKIKTIMTFLNFNIFVSKCVMIHFTLSSLRFNQEKSRNNDDAVSNSCSPPTLISYYYVAGLLINYAMATLLCLR